MAKFEFIKEINLKGEVIYYTEEDGRYVSSSLSADIEEARKVFGRIVEGRKAPLREVLETQEV